MGVKITFSNIIFRVTRDSADVTVSERKSGKLQARTITSNMGGARVIDVLILKNKYPDSEHNKIEFDENDIREGSRRTVTELNDFFKKAGRIPVHTVFFKLLEEGDKIEIILHT